MSLEAPSHVSVETIADLYHHHAKMAEVSFKEHNLLPQMITPSQVIIGDKKEGEPFLPIDIYLDRLRSAHNIGSIIRTTEAFRLGKVIFSKEMIDASSKQIQDTSMGASEWVACEKTSDLSTLKRPLIALETVEGAPAYFDFTFPPSFTLALGNEEQGLSSEVLEKADICIQIPLWGRKNSLNVASAFSIVAGEICRQQRPQK